MRRFLMIITLMLLCCFTLAAPACAETFDDYAALAEAFNAADEDVTLTLGADLLFVEGGSCILNNASKAVITIDGNGHSIDFIGMLDGTLVLQNVDITSKVAISSMKKSNTTSLTIGADASVGQLVGGISIPQDALGTIHIRNEGVCGQISSTGCKAKISIENIGLIEAVLGISISDQRINADYQLASDNGKVTIVNDGVIRGLTSAGMMLALNSGTDVSVTGSGLIEGPCGVVVFCQKSRANVTLAQDIRTCNAAFAADPAKYAELWAELGEQGVELGLPGTTGDKALSAEYQREFRIAQLDLLFNLCICDGEDVIGRALVLPQTDDQPYNGNITVTGTLYGEEGLVVLPDMNLLKGTLSIKSEIDKDSPVQLVDMHYAKNVSSITEEKWGKKVKSLVKKVFPSGLPESVTVRTWGIRHDAETDGLVYTTGWQGYAMDELRAVQAEGKGKWSVTTHPLPSPGDTMTRYELGSKLAMAPDETTMYLDNDVTCGALDDYYNWYTFAGGDIVIDGQGHNFVDIADEEKRRQMHPVEYRMNDGITLRNFGVYDGLALYGGKYAKGEALLENITALRGLWLRSVNAVLSNVTSEADFDADININCSSEYVKKATVTIDESTALYGFMEISAGGYSDRVNTLTIVNNGVLARASYSAWNGSLTASRKSTLKITGSGVLGNLENDDPDRGHYDVHAYEGGKIIIDHTVAGLNIIAGIDPNSSYKPNGTVQIGGSCRFLTVECEPDASKCTITVTATGLEVFRVLMEVDDRTEPMTDKEAASYIKKNGPALTYKKATDPNGSKVAPTYRITGTDGALLWEGQTK